MHASTSRAENGQGVYSKAHLIPSSSVILTRLNKIVFLLFQHNCQAGWARWMVVTWPRWQQRSLEEGTKHIVTFRTNVSCLGEEVDIVGEAAVHKEAVIVAHFIYHVLSIPRLILEDNFANLREIIRNMCVTVATSIAAIITAIGSTSFFHDSELHTERRVPLRQVAPPAAVG